MRGFSCSTPCYSMRVRLAIIRRCCALLLLPAFAQMPQALAGNDPIPSGQTHAQEGRAPQYSGVKPDLRLPLHTKEESSALMPWRMNSLNENKTANAALPGSIPAVGPATKTRPDSANPLNRWPYFLPFFADEAWDRGHRLPYALGFMPGFYSGRRHIKVSDAAVDIAGSTISAAGLTRIKVKSRELNWSMRLDAWIFPFLSVYALGGYTRQHTDAAIQAGRFDRKRDGRRVRSVDFNIAIDLTGATYGGGITLVGGYKNYFAAFDTNYTVSVLRGDLIWGNRLSPDVKAHLCSVRLGWRKQICDSHLAVWFGETYWDTTNTIRGNPDIPIIGKVGFSLKESTIKPWSTHIGAQFELTQKVQFMVDMGTNFSGLFCITPAFMHRF